MDRIIILGEEPELLDLAQAIDRYYCDKKADVIMYNDMNVGEKTDSDNLYLVGHAGARVIGRYSFDDLMRYFGAHIQGARRAVFLAGCSTHAEADQILQQGFVALDLAKNVQTRTKAKVYGTPGVLIGTHHHDGMRLHVEVRAGSGYTANDIFVPAF